VFVYLKMTTLPTSFLGKTISLGTSTFGEIVTPYYVAASNSNDALNIALASDVSNSSMAVKFHMDYTKVLERATKNRIDTLANSINTVGADSNVRNTVLSVDAVLNDTLNTVVSKLQLLEHFCLLVNQNVTIQGDNGSVLPVRGVGSLPWAVASYTRAEPKLPFNLSTLSRDMPNQSSRLLGTTTLPTLGTIPDVFATDGLGAGPGSFVSFDFANAPILFDQNVHGEFPQGWNFNRPYTWGGSDSPNRLSPNYSFLPFDANRPGFSDLAFDAGKNALYFKQTGASVPNGYAPNDPYDIITMMMYAIQQFQGMNPFFGPDSFTITIFNYADTSIRTVVKPTAFSLSGSDSYGLATVQVTGAPLLIGYGHTSNVSTYPYPSDIIIPPSLDGRNPSVKVTFKINYDFVQIMSNSGVGQWANTDFTSYSPNNTFSWSLNYFDQVSAQLSTKPQFLVIDDGRDNAQDVLGILKSQYYQSSGTDGGGIGTLSDRVVIYNITQIINSVPDIANVTLVFTSGNTSIEIGFLYQPAETVVGRWTDQYYSYKVIVLSGGSLKDAFTTLGNLPFTLTVNVPTF